MSNCFIFWESVKKNIIMITVLAILGIIIFPIPALVLDILIAMNLLFAFLILIVVVRSKTSTDFSLLPTTILLSTIFSLALNISTGRLILTKREEFDGRFIGFMSSLFADADDIIGLIAGFIIFIVIVSIHLLIVVKGISRVSEVAARFTLDSYPCKLMAIDAEYSSGVINEQETFLRKKALQTESDFYGALDGASKFVSGNEKLRLLIIAVTIIGGILIGLFLNGESIINAAKIYVPLTIGSGILLILPAFLISAAMGITVTRTVYTAKPSKNETTYSYSFMAPPDQLMLELGHGLFPLADKENGSEFFERLQRMRCRIALDLGIIIPEIRIVNNILLGTSDYCIRIRSLEVGKGTIRIGDEAEKAGYTVADPSSIITTHLTEIIKHYAAELIGRQETLALIESVKNNYPALAKEVFTDKQGATLGNIRKVLQGLLEEQVSIRNIVSILEVIADYDPNTDTRFIIEMVRKALSGQICNQYADGKHTLHVFTLEQTLEQKIIESKAKDGSGKIVAALEPKLHTAWMKEVVKAVKTAHDQSCCPIILCSVQARYLVKTTLDREFPEFTVLSVDEIAKEYSVISVGIISLGQKQLKNKLPKKGNPNGR